MTNILANQPSQNVPGLTKNQNTSLQVLGYLFFRMGLWDKAEHTFNALISLNSNEGSCPLSHAALAAIALERKNGSSAMQHLESAMKNVPISSKNAAFHLMRAKALWLEERNDEAKLAIEEYIYIIGSNKKV